MFVYLFFLLKIICFPPNHSESFLRKYTVGFLLQLGLRIVFLNSTSRGG